PELEHVGPIVGLRPRFREIRLEGLGSRDDRRAGLHLDEAAVREREVRRDAVVIRDEVRVESGGRVFAADAEYPAALTRFRRQRFGGVDGVCRHGGTSQLEEVTSGERHRGRLPDLIRWADVICFRWSRQMPDGRAKLTGPASALQWRRARGTVRRGDAPGG